jgi:hypothetical protein
MPYEIDLPHSPNGGYYTYRTDRNLIEWLIENGGHPFASMEVFALKDSYGDENWEGDPTRKVIPGTVEWNQVTNDYQTLKIGTWLRITTLYHENWEWVQRFRVQRTPNTSTSTIDSTKFIIKDEFLAIQFKLVMASLCE